MNYTSVADSTQRSNFYPVTKRVYSICEHFASPFPLFGSDLACSYEPRLIFFGRVVDNAIKLVLVVVNSRRVYVNEKSTN